MIELQYNKKYKMPVVLALGFFDSVHMGHRNIIDKIICYASKYQCSAAIMTFENNPYTVTGSGTKLIYTYSERLLLLKELNVNAVLKITFDKEFMSLNAQNFADILHNNFNIKHIVCGYDFNFGAGARGNAEFLRNYFLKYNINTDIIKQITYGGQRVSSTLIRKYLSSGDIEKANTLLDEPYFITGIVIHGRKIGSKVLFPTINIKPDEQKKRLRGGVYCTQTVIDNKAYISVTNCGSKPTFDNDDYGIETYITDYNGNLYNKLVTVKFYKRLRDIIKFEDAAQLKSQILKDIECAKKICTGITV